MKTAKTNVKDHEQARADITFNGKEAVMSLDWEKPSRFYIHVRGKGINKVIAEEYDPRAILLEWVRAMKKYGGELVARTPKQKELLQKQRQLAADWKNMKSAYFAPGFLRMVRMAYLRDIRAETEAANRKLPAVVQGDSVQRELVAVMSHVLKKISSQVQKMDLSDRKQAVQLYGGLLSILTTYSQGTGPNYDRKKQLFPGEPTPEQQKWIKSAPDARLATIIKMALKGYPEILKAFNEHKIDKKKWASVVQAANWKDVAKKLHDAKKGKTQDDLHYRAYLRAIMQGAPSGHLVKKYKGAKQAQEDLIDEYGKQPPTRGSVTEAASFKIGDEVQVLAGPHKGKKGKITAIVDNQIHVNVGGFGAGDTAVVDPKGIKPVTKYKFEKKGTGKFFVTGVDEKKGISYQWRFPTEEEAATAAQDLSKRAVEVMVRKVGQKPRHFQKGKEVRSSVKYAQTKADARKAAADASRSFGKIYMKFLDQAENVVEDFKSDLDESSANQGIDADFTKLMKGLEDGFEDMVDKYAKSAFQKRKSSVVQAKTPYQEYFDKKLKEWGIKSPAELDEAKKKIFFEQVDKGWKGKDEKPEPGDSKGEMVPMDSVSGKKRDYAKEYRDYHSKPEQKKNRAKRNSARRKLGLEKGDSREVDHKTPLSKGGGNSDKNLRAVSRKTNRQKGDRQAVADVAAAAQAVGKAQKAIMHYLLRNQSGVTELTEMVAYPTFRGMHFGAVEKAAQALAKKGLIIFKGGKVALNPKGASFRQAALPPPAEQLKMMTANPPRLKGTQIEIFSPTVKKYIGMTEWPDAASAKKDLAMWMASHKETLTKLKQLAGTASAAVEGGDGWKEVKLPGKPYPYRWRTNDLYKKNPRTQAALDIQYKNPKAGWKDVTNLSIRDAVQKAAKKQGLKTGEVQGATSLKKLPSKGGPQQEYRWVVVRDGQEIGLITKFKTTKTDIGPYKAFGSEGGKAGPPFQKLLGMFYDQSEFNKWAKGKKPGTLPQNVQRGGQAAAVKAIEKAAGRTAAVEGRKDPQIAKTILQQLGGSGRLKAMLGAKHFIDHGNGLSFQFPNPKRNRGNYFKVTLDEGSDTYNLEFGKIAGSSYKKLKEMDGIYANAMKKIFEGFTGLRMSL